jgi:hypothetical protein
LGILAVAFFYYGEPASISKVALLVHYRLNWASSLASKENQQAKLDPYSPEETFGADYRATRSAGDLTSFYLRLCAIAINLNA